MPGDDAKPPLGVAATAMMDDGRWMCPYFAHREGSSLRYFSFAHFRPSSIPPEKGFRAHRKRESGVDHEPLARSCQCQDGRLRVSPSMGGKWLRMRVLQRVPVASGENGNRRQGIVEEEENTP